MSANSSASRGTAAGPTNGLSLGEQQQHGRRDARARTRAHAPPSACSSDCALSRWSACHWNPPGTSRNERRASTSAAAGVTFENPAARSAIAVVALREHAARSCRAAPASRATPAPSPRALRRLRPSAATRLRAGSACRRARGTSPRTASRSRAPREWPSSVQRCQPSSSATSSKIADVLPDVVRGIGGARSRSGRGPPDRARRSRSPEAAARADRSCPHCRASRATRARAARRARPRPRPRA